MVLSVERRDEKMCSTSSINCNSSTYDIKKSSNNLTSDMAGNDNFDDSDDSDEMPDFDHNLESAIEDSKNRETSFKQQMSCNGISMENPYSKEGGDVYNNTIRTESISSLVIGPKVENNHKYVQKPCKRHRKISSTSQSNITSATNINDAISNDTEGPMTQNDNGNNTEGEIKDTVLEMNPNPIAPILESSSDEEELDLEENITDVEEGSNSTISPPSKAQFDTKVNIRMPNEGPPKIEIQQQIENKYLGPVYILDAETTKQLVLMNPSIIAQICNRETANIPRINDINQSMRKTEQETGESNRKKSCTSTADKDLSANGTRQRVQLNQRSFRKRNQRLNKDCSNESNKVGYIFELDFDLSSTKT